MKVRTLFLCISSNAPSPNKIPPLAVHDYMNDNWLNSVRQTYTRWKKVQRTHFLNHLLKTYKLHLFCKKQVHPWFSVQQAEVHTYKHKKEIISFYPFEICHLSNLISIFWASITRGIKHNNVICLYPVIIAPLPSFKSSKL